MQLKYLKGDRINVYGGAKMEAFLLSPEGEVPDNLAKHLLKVHPDTFAIAIKHLEETVEVVKDEPKEKAVCELCGKEVATIHALALHKKFKHKEKQ